ncbi:hypothetical protein CARUB_v10001846mg, partial [Capsella rubella]
LNRIEKCLLLLQSFAICVLLSEEHILFLNLRQIIKMFTSLAFATAPISTTIVSATRRSQVSQPKAKKAKPENKRPMTTSTSGFSGRTKELTWQCVEGCGACCKLAKDFAFATPDEIFDDPDDVELYRSMIGDDGWCINYNKATRKCSIYAGIITLLAYQIGLSLIHLLCFERFLTFLSSDRPYFCRVEPEVFKSLYGIEEKKFNKEAVSCCIDTIKTIHGPDSKELDNFNRAIRSSPSSS